MTWKFAPFHDVIVDSSGGNPKLPQSEFRRVGRFPVVDQGRTEVAGFCDDQSMLCQAGSPVIVFGDHTRVIKFVDYPFVVGADGVKVLAVQDGWNPRFIYHYLRFKNIPSVGYSRHYKFLKEISFPCAPLVDQERIATILDTAESLLSRAARSQELRGDLEAAMFAERFEKGKNLRTRFVSQFVTSIDNGRSPLCEPRAATEDEWGVLKLSAVSYGEFRPAENKLLPVHEQVDHRNEIRAGDLLMSRKNTRELVGAAVLVTKTRPKLLLPDLIFRLNVDETQVDKSYLATMLMRPGPRAAVRDLAGGSAASMMNISKARLMDLELPVAPLVEQQEFARDLARVDSSSSIQRQRFERLQALKASLTARAFLGEL